MKKWMVLALFLISVTPVMIPQVYAAEETAQAGITDVGNKLCPVMGGPVNGKDFVVYGGKRYGLCCPGCEKAFLADPASYVAKVNTEKTAEISVSETMERDMEQGEL